MAEEIKYFSNSKEELEYYKKNYKSNAEELSSCKSKIKVLENINNKLKEKITLALSSTTDHNDTSKSFYTNNEFKKLWESIIQTELIDSFDFCIKEYKLISNLCQDIMILIYDETKKIIELKFLEILKCLNLSKTSKDKKENLYIKILPFLRENFDNIFEFSNEKMKNVKEKLTNIINQYNFLNEVKIISSASSKNLNDISINGNDKNNNRKHINNNSDIYKIIDNKIKGNYFDGIMKSFFGICLYMILHEPILNFDIEKYSQRKLLYYFYNKKDFINVEGFGNEKTPCVVILPPPLLKKKYQFNGLKPAVYVLSDININSDIYNQCKINERKKEEEKINQFKNVISEEEKEKKRINEIDNKIKSNDTKNNSKIIIDLNNNDTLNNNKKDNNINDHNMSNTNIKNNIKYNYVKITNNTNNIMKEGNKKENNINYKLVKNISINNSNKNRQKNNQIQKHISNIINKNNYLLDNNKVVYQNLSYGYIQNQNLKEKKIKINYIKTNSNEKKNNNDNIITMSRKEKTLPGKLNQKNEFIIYENNPFLNSSQKMQRNNINNNKYQYFIEDIYEDDEKDYPRNNFDNYQLNISSKPFGKIKKYTKNPVSMTSGLNPINKINNNLKNSQEIKPKKIIENELNYNYHNNYINKNNNNININNFDYEKFKKNNCTGTPSSEKINMKYYSSLGNILTNQNQKNIINNSNDNNYNYTNIQNNNNKVECEYNFKEKKINYYSYDDFSNNNRIKNINENKYSERKAIIINPDHNKNINLSKYYNIINNSHNNIDNKEKKIDIIKQPKKNYYINNIMNIKDNKAYNHSLKKNNLNPLFNSINDSNTSDNIKYNINCSKENHILNNKINYINNINNYNNIKNINNINNINYYNNIYNNNSIISLNNNDLINHKNNSNINNKYFTSKINLRNSNNLKKDKRKKSKENFLSKTTSKSKNYKFKDNKISGIYQASKEGETNNCDPQNSMDIGNLKLHKENKNEKELNDFLAKYNQITKEKNKLEKCFNPIYLDVHDNTNIQKNKNSQLNNKKNILKKQPNKTSENTEINNKERNNKNKICGIKNIILNNKNIIKNNNNKIENNKNIIKNNKKRNKSFSNNSTNKINYENNNDINNSNINGNEIKNTNKKTFFKFSGDNINKIEYDNNSNDMKNYNTFKNNINASYILNNYYLNEIEVLKLKDKYQFNDSSLK